MTAGNAADRSERSLHTVGGSGTVAGLVSAAAALGVRLEARPGGRLWADRLDLLPAALRDSFATHRLAVLRLLVEQPMHAAASPAGVPAAPPLASVLPGVPDNWCRGVMLLVTRPAPLTIPPRRWAILAATATRLLQDHGAELHAAGWDALDLFGLHATAPGTNPPGWGLAWLLGAAGEVLDVAPDVIGMRLGPDGARLAFQRGCAAARARVVPAWALDDSGQAAEQGRPAVAK